MKRPTFVWLRLIASVGVIAVVIAVLVVIQSFGAVKVSGASPNQRITCINQSSGPVADRPEGAGDTIARAAIKKSKGTMR
ncbi:MAG: hypothetical protein GY794_00930 [bacterium]|nr:hypothetical protein [bacterium]